MKCFCSEQALVLNNASRRQSTAGEMVNLMSIDTQRIVNLVTYINMLWSSPLQIVIAIYFLSVTMGISILAGVGVLLLLIPVNFLVARQARRQQVDIDLPFICRYQTKCLKTKLLPWIQCLCTRNLPPCPIYELVQSCVFDTKEINTCQHLSIVLNVWFLIYPPSTFNLNQLCTMFCNVVPID